LLDPKKTEHKGSRPQTTSSSNLDAETTNTTTASSSSPPNPKAHVGSANTCSSPPVMSNKTVYFQTVPVRLEGTNGAGSIDMYAILDDGSSDSLIRQDLADNLKLCGPECELTLGNIEDEGTTKLSRKVNLNVTPIGKGAIEKAVHIEHVWTVPRLNIPPRQLVKESDRQRWKHLEDLDIPAISTNQVDLLIGVEVPEAMIQKEHRRGSKGQPYAIRTDFGWTIAGADIKIPPLKVPKFMPTT